MRKESEGLSHSNDEDQSRNHEVTDDEQKLKQFFSAASRRASSVGMRPRRDVNINSRQKSERERDVMLLGSCGRWEG